MGGISAEAPPGHQTVRTTDVLLGCATAWSVVVLIAAYLLPIETVDNGRPGNTPRFSLVHVHGLVILLPAGIPLFASLLVWALLATSQRGHRWAIRLA